MMPGGTVLFCRNQLCYVSCLWTFGTLNNVKRYTLSFFKGLISISLNCAEVYKHIFSAFNFDETKTFF